MLYTVHKRTGPLHADSVDARCVELLRLVGLDKKARQMPRDLTQVEMRKLELARAVAAEPKLLIADESMAGLSHSEIEDILLLLKQLNERGITIIMVTHERPLAEQFATRIVTLGDGKLKSDTPNASAAQPSAIDEVQE